MSKLKSAKSVKLSVGDILVHFTDSGKRKGQKIVYDEKSYDVIKINKKTIVLQSWPGDQIVKMKVKV